MYFPGAPYPRDITAPFRIVEGFCPQFFTEDNSFLAVVHKIDCNLESPIASVGIDGCPHYPDLSSIAGDECLPCGFGSLYSRFSLLVSGIGLPLCLGSQVSQIAYGGFDWNVSATRARCQDRNGQRPNGNAEMSTIRWQ